MLNISRVMNNIVTIVYQNKAAALFDGRLDLSKLTYKSNIGVVLGALLKAAGFAWSATGKLLWWRADPAVGGRMASPRPALTAVRSAWGRSCRWCAAPPMGHDVWKKASLGVPPTGLGWAFKHAVPKRYPSWDTLVGRSWLVGDCGRFQVF